MGDRRPKKVWLVRNTINMDDEANARYWAGVFQVSDLDLVTAVMIVGSDAKQVAEFLGDAARNHGTRRS